ncbi:MAG: helix-turn-helix domain-containing protein [Ginsengibacter sp.]
MKKITSEKVYSKALTEIYHLMQKGENNLTEKDANNISDMAKIIQDYEKVNYPFPMPKTIGEIVELKMFEKKLNRVSLAKMLGIGAPKLSQILNNKREPDVPFLKALHEKLGVDGNFILERV